MTAEERISKCCTRFGLECLDGQEINMLQVECIRGNVLGVLNLADVTMQKGLHMTNFATGCIFHYDDKFTIESGKVCPPSKHLLVWQAP